MRARGVGLVSKRDKTFHCGSSSRRPGRRRIFLGLLEPGPCPFVGVPFGRSSFSVRDLHRARRGSVPMRSARVTSAPTCAPYLDQELSRSALTFCTIPSIHRSRWLFTLSQQWRRTARRRCDGRSRPGERDVSHSEAHVHGRALTGGSSRGSLSPSTVVGAQGRSPPAKRRLRGPYSTSRAGSPTELKPTTCRSSCAASGTPSPRCTIYAHQRSIHQRGVRDACHRRAQAWMTETTGVRLAAGPGHRTEISAVSDSVRCAARRHRRPRSRCSASDTSSARIGRPQGRPVDHEV